METLFFKDQKTIKLIQTIWIRSSVHPPPLFYTLPWCIFAKSTQGDSNYSPLPVNSELKSTTTIPKSLMLISTYSCFTIPLKSSIVLKVDTVNPIGYENETFINLKNPNKGSLLFCKSPFAQPPKIVKMWHQKFFDVQSFNASK